MIDVSQTLSHALEAIDRARVSRDPFAHFQLKDIFPVGVYQTLINNLPDKNLYHEIRHKDAMRPDGTSTRTMFEFFDEEFARLDDAHARLWSGVRDVLYAKELQELVFKKFAPEIDARVETEVQHQKLQRDENRNVIGFPRPALYHDAAGYKITPHPDTPLKIVTMQFYLPANDSQQELGTSLFRMKSGLERALSPLSGKFKTVKKFPFLPNTGYAFAVTQNSWHGRETVIEKQGDRCSIITFYLREDVRLKY
jgi:hypothetical protein